VFASAPGGAGEPAFSPDGKTVAFIARTSAGGDYRLYEMAADGSGTHQVPAPPGRIDGPDWSPDGKRLVLAAVGPPPRSREDLWVENADGSNQVEITHGPGDSTAPQWSPGSEVAFVRVAGSHVNIDVVKPDGTGERQLTSGQGKNGGPVWRP
jgi:TolB protein